MNLLPVAIPAAPANAAGSDDPATTGSGDFTALLAMLVGAASTTLPIDTPPALSGEPAGSADPLSVSAEAPDPPRAEVPDSPVPAALLEAPITPLVPAPAEPSASTVAAPRRRVDPPRAEAAAPAVPAQDGEPRIPALPAVPTQPAVSAHQFRPSESQPVVSQPVESQPVQAPRPQPAESHNPSADADVVVPAPDGAEVRPVPTPGTGDHERRSETLMLPEVAPFDRPPLGGPSQPQPDPDHGADRRPPPGQTVSPFERPPVDVPAADHVAAWPVPKAAARPAAPSSPPGATTQVVPLVAANRSNTLAPVAEAPVAAAAPATVPEQIVSAVVPLHGRGDGRHEVTLELRPENLGTIRVEVAVEHQTVHLTLHAAEPATSRLLSANLPELRAALADAGLTAGQVGVGLDGSGGGQRRSSPEGSEGGLRSPGAAGLRVTAPDEPSPVRLRPAAAGRLDLLL